MTPHGTMIALQDAAGLRFVIPAIATPNVRIATAIPMFRNLLEEFMQTRSPRLSPSGRRMLVIQFDDRIHHNISSVAFCRRRGEAPAVQLIPDTYFFLSRGYQSLRRPATEGILPRWEDREDIVFWRGSATNNGTAIGGSRIERIEQIPRVALCLALSREDLTDAAISFGWGFDFPMHQQVECFSKHGIYRSAVPMLRQAHYRYLIDIDGVASAWGFFEKLLLGACVLKIGSPFEQWYYSKLSEWQHFVPVRGDLSNLAKQIEWCREHPRQAREIAGEGQRFALEHSFATARRVISEAVTRALLTW